VAIAKLTLLMLQAALPAAAPPDVWSAMNPERTCAVSAVWHIGTGTSSTPHAMVESVSPLEVGGRSVWRAMHTLLRGAEEARQGLIPGFDFYDLDRATLAPVQSEHRGSASQGAPAAVTRFAYESDSGSVHRLSPDGTPIESIPLNGRRPFPEGPGSAAVYQAIDWRDGQRLRAHVLDRWRGRASARLRAVDLEVTGRGAVRVGGRRIPAYIVTETALDGSYQAVNSVTIDRPHIVLRTEYSRGPRRTVSEVTAFTRDPACEGTG